MEETTTPAPVHVTGRPHDHPSVRRLARACLALARWQLSHQLVGVPAEPAPVRQPTRPGTTS